MYSLALKATKLNTLEAFKDADDDKFKTNLDDNK